MEAVASIRHRVPVLGDHRPVDPLDAPDEPAYSHLPPSSNAPSQSVLPPRSCLKALRESFSSRPSAMTANSMKDDDGVKASPTKLSARAERILTGAYVVGYCISFILYMKTLVAIPSPDKIKDYLPVLAPQLAGSIFAFSAVLVSSIMCVRWVGTRLRNGTVLWGVTQAALLFAYDHGTNLDGHGLYNFVLFALSTTGILCALTLARCLYHTLSTRRLVIFVVGLALFIVTFSFVAVAQHRDSWLASITGHRMVPVGGAITVPVWNDQTGSFQTVEKSWDGCTYDFGKISFPIMDVLPTGTQNFWSGDWWNCPKPTIEEFTVQHDVDWAGFEEAMKAAGVVGDAAQGAEQCDNVKSKGELRPAITIMISGCPDTMPLSVTALPDTRKFSVLEKHEKMLQAAVMAKGMKRVIRPADQEEADDGSEMASIAVHTNGRGVIVEVPSSIDTEVFEVTCGLEHRYIMAARPPLRVLSRLKKQNPDAQFERLAAGAAQDPKIPLRTPNAIVLTLDAVSRTHFKRKMPKTVDMLRNMGGLPKAQHLGKQQTPTDGAMHVFEYMRHHSVGFTTGENTIPMYTGCDGEKPCNEPMYERFASKGGYATAWIMGMCEDWAGAFPRYPANVDHEAESQVCVPEAHPLGQPYGVLNGPYSIRRRCLGGQYVHKHLMDYSLQLYDLYSKVGVPLYLHATFLEGHEGTGEVLGTLDADFAAFLEALFITRRAAADSLMFLLADHGTVEHMNPTLYLGVPRKPTVRSLAKYLTPDVLSNLASNQHSLVSGYDVFWTWRAIVDDISKAEPVKLCSDEKVDASDLRGEFPVAKKSSARSLFERIPFSRSCEDANIPELFCKCH